MMKIVFFIIFRLFIFCVENSLDFDQQFATTNIGQCIDRCRVRITLCNDTSYLFVVLLALDKNVKFRHMQVVSPTTAAQEILFRYEMVNILYRLDSLLANRIRIDTLLSTNSRRTRDEAARSTSGFD